MADRPQPPRGMSRPVLDADLLQRFEAWRTAQPAPISPGPWYRRVLPSLLSGFPGTVEWQFRRWNASRRFVVSE